MQLTDSRSSDPSQALLANISAMYAVYHGPEGLRQIAEKVHGLTRVVAAVVGKLGHKVVNESFFGDLSIRLSGTAASVLHEAAAERNVNLRRIDDNHVAVSFDESHGLEDVVDLVNVFVSIQTNANRPGRASEYTAESLVAFAESIGVQAPRPLGASTGVRSTGRDIPPIDSPAIPKHLARTTPFLTQSVWNSHHSETDILRYMHHLQSKDLSLVHAPMPVHLSSLPLLLASPAAARLTLSLARSQSSRLVHDEAQLDDLAHALHLGRVRQDPPLRPCRPGRRLQGDDRRASLLLLLLLLPYESVQRHLLTPRHRPQELAHDLSKLTGLPGCSLQPNSGAQGEYAGLSVIRAYHLSRGNGHRNVCLVPASAHGTNPASAVMAGMRVVPVKNLASGYLDLADLKAKAEKHKDDLAAFMVTYPSTFGVFEGGIEEACEVIHSHGGQVYLDGASRSRLSCSLSTSQG